MANYRDPRQVRDEFLDRLTALHPDQQPHLAQYAREYVDAMEAQFGEHHWLAFASSSDMIAGFTGWMGEQH